MKSRQLIPVALLACAVVLGAGESLVRVLDIRGQSIRPLQPSGKAGVLFFVSTDCPISNSFAPEIQRICNDYAHKGVGCSLVYEDYQVDAVAVGKHLEDYQYDHFSAIIDGARKIAGQTHATVTPQAVVIDGSAKIRYRGRINNFYAELGKPRQVVTVHDLRNALDAVLAAKPLRFPKPKHLAAISCRRT